MSEETATVVNVTGENFESEVLNSDRLTIVDFWAPWCGICSAIRPLLDEFAEREKKRVKVVMVNTQECPDIANRYGIMALPTFLVFKGGRVVRQHVGALAERKLIEFVEASG